MTRQEAIKILSVLKAAYPNSYRGMTKEEANGTVNVWASPDCTTYSVAAISRHRQRTANGDLIPKSELPSWKRKMQDFLIALKLCKVIDVRQNVN